MPIREAAGPLRSSKGPAVVLCSRGFSFERRLEKAVEFAQRNHIRNVLLLHCPERRYSEPLAREVELRAERLFEECNGHLREMGEDGLTFELLLCKGLLQENLRLLLAQDRAGEVVTVFVGDKMLDYRLEDIKTMRVPFFFVE